MTALVSTSAARRRRRGRSWTTVAGRAAAVLLVPLATWWGLDSSPAIKVGPFELLTPTVPRGGNIKIRYWTTFFRRCSGSASRFLEDASGRPIEFAGYKFRDGIGRNGEPVPLENPQWVYVEATIPDGATPGPALYQNVTDFYCNPLQRVLERGIRFSYPLVRFTILTDHAAQLAGPPVTAFQPVDGGLDLRDRASAMVPAPSLSPLKDP